MAMTARLDLGDPALAAAVADVRDDNTDTAWCQFGYEGKVKIVLAGKGSGGVDELLDEMDDSQVSFVLLRLTTGDQESKRIKFMCAHLSRSPLPHVRVISACSPTRTAARTDHGAPCAASSRTSAPASAAWPAAASARTRAT